MKKKYLSPKQIGELKALGFSCATRTIFPAIDEHSWELGPHSVTNELVTLEDILTNALSEAYAIAIDRLDNSQWNVYVEFRNEQKQKMAVSSQSIDLLDAAFDALKWAIENKLVNTDAYESNH